MKLNTKEPLLIFQLAKNELYIRQVLDIKLKNSSKK